MLHYGYKDKRIMIKLIYFTILIFTISLSSIQGAIINVPEDFQTIRNAVGASEDGDTILLQPRRYRETISFNGKEIWWDIWKKGSSNHVCFDQTKYPEKKNHWEEKP